MNMQFKAILTNKKLYKEVLLSENAKSVAVGTMPNVDVRLPQTPFFEKFKLEFWNEGDCWTVVCSPNIYLTDGAMNKLPQKQLKHGEELHIKYFSTDAELLSMSVMIDFDEVDQDFCRVISIQQKQKIQIGGSEDCDIYIKDPGLHGDRICLSCTANGIQLEELSSRFGVYVNGSKAQKKTLLNNFDFFALDQYRFFLKDSCIYTTASGNIQVNGLQQRRETASKSSLEYPKFNRNTRLKAKVCTDEIEVLDPPELPQKPKENLLLTMIPALAMLVVTVFLRGMMGGGGTFVLLSACTMGIGIITSIVNFVAGKRKYKKDMEERRVKYDAYISQKKEKIEAARREELDTLDELYASSEKDTENIMDFSGKLFDKTDRDEDYVEVCLGKGARRSSRPIKYKEQERIEVVDDLALVPEQVAKQYRQVEEAPITLKMADYDAVGVVGRYSGCLEILKVMTLDLAARHYYSDLHLYYVTSPEHAKDIRWARWLPHVENPQIGIRNIVCDEASRNLIFENFFIQLSAETKNKDREPLKQRNIVFVLDDMGIKNHPLSQHIQDCHEKGFTFVFFDHCEEQLPQNCGALIRLSDEGEKAELVETEDCRNAVPFTYESLSNQLMERLSLKLAPVYCDEVSLESSLTKSYTFFQMMNIYTAEDIDLGSNWENAKIEKTMAAPLGINAKKEMVMLDLHEKAHGPHGLVAGTTGSGKSEILQSYILSMAINYHPYEVGFVIIDFKGGGMANQMRDLPHLIGAITNIDGREIDRSLKSIKAELQKRQRLFAENDVNKIDAYIKKYKKGEVQIPLPHLIIIVDEFAELKADQPEFMKELISAARIGRSLGVHLILATQKPSGQVNEQIWSNSRFKLCLKVQTQEDSKEVLKSPLAAEIREPGRAYLQVGNNEIFELFQSAYSGGAAKVDESGNEREFSLEELNLWGKGETVYRHIKKKTNSQEKSGSQLDVVVDYIKDYCQEKQIKHLPNICLPALAEKILYRKTQNPGPEMMMDIGIYDDPDRQYQGEVSMSMSAQNTLIIGSAQTGKTTLLQTMIRSLEDSYTPEQVNIYILDFGSMVLKNFEGSPFVGGVVCASDDEKLKNLFRMFANFMEQRKKRLAEVGVSSFASYCEAGYTDLPQIVLIVDNFTALKEMYLSEEDDLLPICRDGLTVGISVVITNAQTNGLGFRYVSNFAQKIALVCNDSAEYGAVLDRCRMTPANYPGRGLFQINKETFEFQTYLPFEGEKEIERVEAIRAYNQQISERCCGARAIAIPEIPERLDSQYAKQNYPKEMVRPYVVPTGIDYDTVQWISLDLCKVVSLAVTGRERFGKTNYTALILNYLQNHIFDYPAKAYIIDDYDRQLNEFSSCGFVENYTVDHAELDYILSEMEEELKKRQEILRDGGSIEQEPLLLCVLQSGDLMAADGIKKAQADKIRAIIKNYAKMKVLFLFANVDNAPVPFSGPEGMKLAKECKNILCFEDLGNLKLIDIPLAQQRKFKKKVQLGDCYLITEKDIYKQKVICAE